MCFYYLPAFATAFAARPWRTPFAELSRGFRAWRFGFRGEFPTWTRILNPFMEVFDAALLCIYIYYVYCIWYIYLYCVYFGLVVAEHDFNKALKVKPTDLVGLIEAPNLDGWCCELPMFSLCFGDWSFYKLVPQFVIMAKLVNISPRTRVGARYIGSFLKWGYP